jgi:hypothetical protein
MEQVYYVEQLVIVLIESRSQESGEHSHISSHCNQNCFCAGNYSLDDQLAVYFSRERSVARRCNDGDPPRISRLQCQ